MTMPDPRGQYAQSTQFPPPQYASQATQAQVLDPTDPNFQRQLPQAEVPIVDPSTTEVEEYGDYFGFDIREKYVFPDGKQWIEFKVLSEGDLARYQKLLKRDVVVEKQTGDARIKIDQVEERHALIQVAVVDWFVVRKDTRSGRYLPVPFSNGTPGSEVMKWVQAANPAFVADLADQIRKLNPFLLGTGNETIEAIDKQIEDLYKQRALLVERQMGEPVSANS